jgi:hypothetical protein
MMGSEHRRELAGLPPEILLDIAARLADFGSVHVLLEALPMLRRQLDDIILLLKLVDGILYPMPEEIQVAARIHFRLCTRSLTAGLKVEDNLFSALRQDSPEDHMVPSTLTDVDTSAETVRGWLALAAKVQWLTHACIEQCLTVCGQARPARLRDPAFRYPTYGRIWEVRPDGEPFTVSADASGPLTWIEERRAVRMTWLVYVSREMQDRRCVQIGNALSAFEREQLLTINDAMAIIEASLAYRDQAALLVSDSASEPQFATHPDAIQAQQSASKLGATTSATWSFFTYARTHHRSPLRGADFAPFRRYGFALWDRPRMVQMGLLYESKARCLLEPDSLLFTWRSLLTPTEDEQVGRMAKEMDANLVTQR